MIDCPDIPLLEEREHTEGEVLFNDMELMDLYLECRSRNQKMSKYLERLK